MSKKKRPRAGGKHRKQGKKLRVEYSRLLPNQGGGTDDEQLGVGKGKQWKTVGVGMG